MSENRDKADNYLSEAEKRCNSFHGLIGGLIGNGSKFEEGIGFYIKAANYYKMDNNWKAAGQAFSSAAKFNKRCGNKHESILNYISAANCYKKCNPNQAIDCLKKSIEFYTDLGKFSTAAKHHITIAEIYESAFSDFSKAVEHYETAAQYYKGEESNATANKCLLIIANYSALEEKFEKAINIYEDIGKYCIESSLLKYSAKDHFFRASLCHTCIDLLNGEIAIKRYEDIFPAFSDTRECKLMKKLINCLENEDIDSFTDNIKSFDSISRFDKWFVNMLLKIKTKYNSDKDMDFK